MKSKNHNITNYSNRYLKTQPSLTPFFLHPLFFLKGTQTCALNGEIF